jgi:hypothetical protein
MSMQPGTNMAACANNLELPTWVWSDILDELYAHATWLWEHGREELADAIAEVADELARHTMIEPDVDASDGFEDVDR